MKQKVALVLSSGGARGLAHIGVIEELNNQGFEISSISGCSIGAIVGGFYAAGKLDIYKNWICQLDKIDVFKLLDFTFNAQGFIRGEKVFRVMEEMICDCNIEDLSVPFCAVATDALNQCEVVFDSGSLYQALRASSAIPTVLKPVARDNRILIDGAVLNPVPVDKIKRTEGDLLVVVNVNGSFPLPKCPAPLTETEVKKEMAYREKIDLFRKKLSAMFPKSENVEVKKMGFFDILNRSLDLMQDQLANLTIQKYEPDILVEISRETCSTFEFYKAKELIDEGRKAFSSANQKYFESEVILNAKSN